MLVTLTKVLYQHIEDSDPGEDYPPLFMQVEREALFSNHQIFEFCPVSFLDEALEEYSGLVGPCTFAPPSSSPLKPPSKSMVLGVCRYGYSFDYGARCDLRGTPDEIYNLTIM